MQVSVEAGEGLTRRLKVELPAEEIEREVEDKLRGYARTARLPGFRPGKIPLKVLRQRFGEAARMEVLGAQIESSYPKAVLESALRPTGRPTIEPDYDTAAGRYGYVAEFEVIPEVDLVSMQGRSIKRPVVEVVESDVDDMIQRLREQRRRWEPVEREAAKGDQLKADFEGRIDGELFKNGSGEDISVELGSGRFLPGFEDQLIGARAGQALTVETQFPDDYQDAAVAGKAVTFEVKVKEVQEPVLPELDEAFLTEFSIEDGDLERFRADVRNNLERECKQRIKDKVKGQVLDALLEAHPLTLPSPMVAEEVEVLRQQALQNLGGVKISLPDELFEENARRRVALGLIIAAVVSKHGLEPGEEQVRTTLEEMAAAYDDPQAVIDYHYADTQRLAGVKSIVLEELVVEQLLEEFDVEDVQSSFSELASDPASGSASGQGQDQKKDQTQDQASDQATG